MSTDSIIIIEAGRDNTTTVLLNGKLLDPRASQQVMNHSPDGFNWGYSGSGPAQLALAILLEVTGDRSIALRNYQEFKRDHVATWPADYVNTTIDITAYTK
jgi:hypothetical protein